VIKLLQRIWVCYYFFWFALIFLLLYPAFYVLLSKEKWYPYANALRRFWAKSLFLLSGIWWRISYEEKLDPNKTYIFCPNHASYTDIPMFVFLYPRNNFRIMAKVELSKIPLFNIFFRTVDISVDRQSRADAFKALKDAETSVRNNMSLLIFPEGTISPVAPKMGEFKNGPFKLAVENEIAIVPVTFIDDWYLLDLKRGFSGRPGLARAIVHKPIETKGLTKKDVETLKQQTFNTINETLKRYYKMD
jgi:1-acyl-sn-glycerol-3-phosphate acyltransferase